MYTHVKPGLARCQLKLLGLACVEVRKALQSLPPVPRPEVKLMPARKWKNTFSPDNPIVRAMGYVKLTPTELSVAADVSSERVYNLLGGRLLSVPKKVLDVFQAAGLDQVKIAEDYREWRKDESTKLKAQLATTGAGK